MKLRSSGRLKPIAPTRGVLFATALLLALNVFPHGGETAQAGPPPEARNPIEVATALSEAFSQVADRVLPAVVTITSEKVISTGPYADLRGQGFPDFFDNFFGPFRGQTPQAPREYRQRGLGSGFIISSDGTILTANHVVQGAETVKVRLSDDRELTAEVVGTDPKTDVAVLRVESDGALPSIPLGDSNALRVGEWVIALGNPFGEGLRGTVTAGIVSAKGRSRIGLTDYEDFIQTDAAINPGNSGGPLVNLHGEAVGVNTAIASRTGGYQGVGFAVPINLVKKIKDRLLSDGRVVRGWLGVYVGDLNESLRDAFNVPGQGGALVQQVVKDGPADDAGVQDGDIILELDGTPLEDGRDLRFRVADMSPGTRVELVVLRDGSRHTLHVELGVLPADTAEEEGGSETDRPADKLGISVEDLTRDMRRELQLDSSVEGVVVTEVESGSEAEEAGLQLGDVIFQVDRKPVSSVRALRSALGEIGPGEVVLFTVLTDGNRHYVALHMPAE
jgi:serine protease Do